MNNPNFSLQGKVAIVTGARRGIGKTIALAFARAGANIAICDNIIDDGELRAVADEIRSIGCHSLDIQADTNKKTDVDNMIQKVISEFGSIDILVNNAGIFLKGLLMDLPQDDWDKLFSVDLKGYYLCSQAAGKMMVEQKKGNIINIASRCAFKVDIEMGAYCIAKTGVVMLTRVLARELAGYNIRVNAIAPGIVKTEFSRDGWGNPQILERIESSIPLGRIAEPDDMVGTALFLASDASNYITGHTVVIDGGSLA